MIKKRRASKKEKLELALIFGSVLIVAIVGLVVTNLTSEKVSSVAGAAVKLNPNVPTYPGTLVLLKEYCSPVVGTGSCNTLCGAKACIPLEENCDFSMENNQCLCCVIP